MMPISNESKIFKKEGVLSFEYLPEMLPYRESQVKELANSLIPATKGRKPQNTFIFGSPGIGKTASVKYVFREFENFSGIKTIYLNCWDFNTSISILAEITIRLGMPVGRRGLAKDEIISKLTEVLGKSKKGLIVCLDEVDQLIRKDQGVLYDLSRINQYVTNPVGLVFISNNQFIFSNIEPRIKSTLSIEEIEFKPYSIQEMKSILQERAKNAFFSIEDGVIALAANHAINKGGDVRVGLECLLKSGRIAEEENSNVVKVEHLKIIIKDVVKVKPEILKDNINDHQKIVVDLLKENSRLSFGELYNKYCQIAENPVTERAFQDYIKHLDELNLAKIKKRKVNGKRIISKT
jgi:archaeal cell division control protein 6